MRERTIDNVPNSDPCVLTETLFQGTVQNPTAYTTSDSILGNVNGEMHKIMHDVVIPNFKFRSKQGMIFNNPMDVDETFKYSDKIWIQSRHKHRVWDTNCNPDAYRYWGYDYDGSMPGSHYCDGHELAIPEIDVSSLINEAVTKAWSNVELSQATALMSLAEGEKTIQSLVSVFRRALKIILAVRSLNFAALRRELTPKELQNRWMEARYALRPLMYEVSGIMDAVTKDARHDRFTFRGSVSSTETAEDEEVFTSDRGYRFYTLEKHSSRTVEVRAGVLAKLEELSLLNRWGFDQIAETVWEIIPFSFICDWFFNVGKTIASWTPEGGLRTLASWYVVRNLTYQTTIVKDAYVTSCSEADPQNCYENYYHKSVGGTTIIHNTKQRVPSPVRAVLPTFTLKLSAAKLLDLAIIFKQKAF